MSSPASTTEQRRATVSSASLLGAFRRRMGKATRWFALVQRDSLARLSPPWGGVDCRGSLPMLRGTGVPIRWGTLTQRG